MGKRFKKPRFICCAGDLRVGAIVREDGIDREFMVMWIYSPQMGGNFGMYVRPLDDGPGEDFISIPINWMRTA